MSYAINWNTAEQRIKTHKDFLLDTAQKMDEERLKFLLEAYEENKGESSFVLRAKLLEKVLLNKSIFLDENLIVGTISGSRAAVYPYPEWQVNWIKDELDAVKMSSLGEVKISDETKDILKRVYKQWKGKTTYDRSPLCRPAGKDCCRDRRPQDEGRTARNRRSLPLGARTSRPQLPRSLAVLLVHPLLHPDRTVRLRPLYGSYGPVPLPLLQEGYRRRQPDQGTGLHYAEVPVDQAS